MSKILIIDDTQDNLIAISALLRNLIPGCVTITCQSGGEGISKARAESPDVILLDIVMPHMDGYEVCKRLKAESGLEYIPVIMLTAARTDPKSRIKGLDIGADAFLAKPIDEAELVAQVNVAIRIKKAEDRLRKEKDLLEEDVAKSNEDLEQADTRLRMALKSSNIGLFDWNLETDKVYFSPEWKSQIGYEEDEIADEFSKWENLLHPEDKDYVLSVLKDYLNGQRPDYEVEFRFQHKDGSFRWIFSRGELYRGEEQNPTHMLGCHIDITGRKISEEKLRFQSQLLDGVRESVIATDLKGNVMYWSKGAEVLYGHSAEEVMGKSITFIVEPPEEEKEKERILQVHKTGSWNGQSIQKRKDGSLFWADTFISLVTDENGTLSGLIGLDRDITEQVKDKSELKKSEERFRTLVETTTDWIWEMDGKAIFTYVSPKINEILGYEPKEIIGKTMFDLINDKEKERLSEFYDKHKPLLIPFSLFDLEHSHKNGHAVFLEVSGVPIMDEHGKLLGWRGINRDITDRKRAEDEKAKLEEKLRQSQKMEAIGTMAGGIAHDFNNILGIIVGNAEIGMSSVRESNPVHSNLEEILDACLRARDIVRQILSFSRQSMDELRPLNLGEIVKSSITLLRSSIPSTIEIRSDISSDSDTVYADLTQINQVILNLCANAAFAMQDKGGVMDIILENVALGRDDVIHYHGLTSGPYLKLTVRDTGDGIAPETLERIFDPYFTTKDIGKGTGMGLAMVLGIVKKHGGDITVDSEPGKGSAFYVLLPKFEEEAEPEIDSEKPLPRGSERILFVDDEEQLVLAAQHMFENLGYQVIAEQKPVQALEIFKEQPDSFDIVISDMTMPDMTGDMLAKEIMDVRPDMPVILCSGYSERISDAMVKELGIRAIMMKPALAYEIASTIRQIFDQRQ